MSNMFIIGYLPVASTKVGPERAAYYIYINMYIFGWWFGTFFHILGIIIPTG
jgi:hypothetical protein